MLIIIIIPLLILSTLAYKANPTLYSTTSSIYAQMQYLQQKHPSIFTIHQVPQDQQIRYATFGNKSSSLKAIIICGAHARQLLSSEVCINLLKSLVQKWDQYGDLYLVVVPVVNKNRDRVLDGELCLRVNERGVDPNRNYPVNFENGSPQNGSMTYRGPHPLSEKFSKFMDKLLASEEKWNMILDIHTGQLTLFYAEVRNQTLNQQTVALLNKIKHKYCPTCIVDTIQHLEGSIAGEMFKYAATKYQVEHSIEIQIYAGHIESKKGKGERGEDDDDTDMDACMKQFSPNTERARDFYLGRWVRAVEDIVGLVVRLKRGGK